jgi:hypothetical protein
VNALQELEGRLHEAVQRQATAFLARLALVDARRVLRKAVKLSLASDLLDAELHECAAALVALEAAVERATRRLACETDEEN